MSIFFSSVHKIHTVMLTHDRTSVVQLWGWFLESQTLTHTHTDFSNVVTTAV